MGLSDFSSYSAIPQRSFDIFDFTNSKTLRKDVEAQALLPTEVHGEFLQWTAVKRQKLTCEIWSCEAFQSFAASSGVGTASKPTWYIFDLRNKSGFLGFWGWGRSWTRVGMPGLEKRKTTSFKSSNWNTELSPVPRCPEPKSESPSASNPQVHRSDWSNEVNKKYSRCILNSFHPWVLSSLFESLLWSIVKYVLAHSCLLTLLKNDGRLLPLKFRSILILASHLRLCTIL